MVAPASFSFALRWLSFLVVNVFEHCSSSFAFDPFRHCLICLRLVQLIIAHRERPAIGPARRVYVGSTLTILLLRSHVAKKARAEYVHSQRRPPVKHASFGTIVEDIKADSIQVYYEEGKILIDEDEADAYFTMKIKARLAALKPVAEFA
jgi:hypothetical protein